MIVSILFAYFIGSVPFAVLIARWWGTPDPRAVGSGNPGAANVFRVSGTTAGLLVALLDIGKGATSVLLAARLNESPATPVAAGLAAIVGHVYPVWLLLRGGKGVATACGVFAVLAPVATFVAVIMFAVGVWITRFVSVGSVLAALVLPVTVLALGHHSRIVAVAVASSALIVVRHRSNLRRVWLGTERPIGAAS